MSDSDGLQNVTHLGQNTMKIGFAMGLLWPILEDSKHSVGPKGLYFSSVSHGNRIAYNLGFFSPRPPLAPRLEGSSAHGQSFLDVLISWVLCQSLWLWYMSKEGYHKSIPRRFHFTPCGMPEHSEHWMIFLGAQMDINERLFPHRAPDEL